MAAENLQDDSDRELEVALIRNFGWVSRVRAGRAADRLISLAEDIDGTLSGAEGQAWSTELRTVAKYLTRKSR